MNLGFGPKQKSSMKKLINYIISLFTPKRQPPELSEYQRALQVFKEQHQPPDIYRHLCEPPTTTKEYRAACRTILRESESALRFNSDDWLEEGNPHSDPIPVQEQCAEEAKYVHNVSDVDHRAIASTLADGW